MSNWIQEEFSEINLGDARLNKRLELLLKRLENKPGASIPANCKGWAETQAAYRFFSNEKVTKDKILSPHFKTTSQRMQQHPVVLCIEDTSFINHEGQRKTPGLGPHSSELEYGYFLHPLVTFTPEHLCLGSLKVHTWVRDGKFGKRYQHSKKPIKEKESQRWIDGYRTVSEYQKKMPATKLIYIADRESDIYELFAEGKLGEANWLIRAVRNRKVKDTNKILEHLKSQQAVGSISFKLPTTKKRKKRQVNQKIYVSRVTLQGPRRYRSGFLNDIEVTAILAIEENPPAGEEPIQWLLLTNMAVNSLDEAKEKISWYACRWQIEIFFNVLKSGCNIEKLQLEDRNRLEAAVALYLVIAWRILSIRTLSRLFPESPCNIIFEEEEWKALYLVSLNKPPPESPPPLGEAVRLIAALGGYLNRKNDLPPGPKVIWLGMKRLRDFVIALKIQQINMRIKTYV